MMARHDPRTDPPHVPVLIGALIAAVAPVRGVWIDGTFGAGGYARALVAAGAARVIGIDRDATVAAAAPWLAAEAGRIALHPGRFGDLDRIALGLGHDRVDGVVLDLGVSSMQLDTAARGFSFQREGPLDMRMGADGPTAADLVNRLPETVLADILFRYGEERAARRIARRIATARAGAPIATTTALAALVASCLPRPRPGQPHPATRSFQALRIAVNDELGELARGLAAAERMLAPGGLLAVVTFHSLEDRIVKRFLKIASGSAGAGSRHGPDTPVTEPRFERVTQKALLPGEGELAANPRARSAKLRVARRLPAPALGIAPGLLGVPDLALPEMR